MNQHRWYEKKVCCYQKSFRGLLRRFLFHPALDGGQGGRPAAILPAQTIDHLHPGKSGVVAGEGPADGGVRGEARCSGPRFLHAGNIRKREGRRFRQVRQMREENPSFSLARVPSLIKGRSKRSPQR